MVQKEKLYESTNNGLDILRYYYPFLTEEIAEQKKKFRLREEKDASASMRLHNGCYRITDFGNDGKEYTPIDVVMREENLNFSQAILLLSQRHGIREEEGEAVVKPTRTERAAADAEQDGDFFFEEHDPTPQELAIMGRGVTAQDFKALNWHALTSYTIIRDRKAITKTATPSYPIFARRCTFISNGKEAVSYTHLTLPTRCQV